MGKAISMTIMCPQGKPISVPVNMIDYTNNFVTYRCKCGEIHKTGVDWKNNEINTDGY